MRISIVAAFVALLGLAQQAVAGEIAAHSLKELGIARRNPAPVPDNEAANLVKRNQFDPRKAATKVKRDLLPRHSPGKHCDPTKNIDDTGFNKACIARAIIHLNQKTSCDSAGQCVECTNDSGCAFNLEGKVCNTATDKCVKCLDDGDCKLRPLRPHCNTATNTCTA